MAIRFKIVDSLKKIKNNITTSIKDEVSKILGSRRRKIRERIKVIVYEAVYNSIAMKSVRNGILNYEFGLTDDPTEAIADAVSRSVDIQVTEGKNNSGPLGGYSVKIQPSNYLNVLNLSEAVQITEKGDTLPWLDWLLTYGDETIIFDFKVKKGKGLGRSGGGIMITAKDSGFFFKVNKAFQGTEENNFITRSIEKVGPRINQEIIRILQ
jgi:hypothetical protein